MVYKARLINALRELADENLQRTRWLSPSGPEVSSFVEVYSQLFDDTGLGDALDKGAFVFGEPIDCNLRKLGDTMAKVDASLPPDVLIVHPQIHRIRRSANEILQLLLIKNSEEAEGDSIEGPS